MKKKILFVLMLALVLTVFAACEGQLPGGSKTLSAVSDLRYDGAVLSWNAVENAQKYAVSINGAEAISAPGAMFAYANTSGAPFTVSIVAKAEGYQDSEAVSITFSPLNTVTNVTISDDGTISYDPVDGAAYYLVNVDGVDHMVNGLSYDQLTAGTHVVKISAKADSADGSVVYYSKYTDPKTVVICGEVDPEQILFDSMTATLTWMGVSDAQAYEVRVQSNSDIVTEVVTRTSFAFDPHNSNFTVSIRALGNHVSSYDSKVAVEKSFIYLETARNLHLEDGILHWDDVAGADGYKLRLNNSTIVVVEDNQYDGLPVNASVDVEIMPISNENAYFTSWSVRETFKILPAPVLQWVGNHDGFDGSMVSSVVWDAVENAEGYVVSIAYMAPDAKEPETPQLTTLSKLIVAFEYDYLNAGTYIIKVKSLANDADPNVSDSKYSQEIKVSRLAAPTLLSQNAITSNADNLQDGVTVSFNSVARASEYRIWKENNVYQTVTTSQFKDYNVVSPEVIV